MKLVFATTLLLMTSAAYAKNCTTVARNSAVAVIANELDVPSSVCEAVFKSSNGNADTTIYSFDVICGAGHHSFDIALDNKTCKSIDPDLN